LSDGNKKLRSRPQRASNREERAHRILDCAAELILRWGYNKTTVDDIARAAGVAKGTIYLHFKTREELFGTLIKRERVRLAESLKQSVMADPAGSTLHGFFKSSALAMMKRPLMKAILMRDLEILGKLAKSEHGSASYTERLAAFRIYLQSLREHRLVRTDISLDSQIYMIGAIFMGFFFAGPLMPYECALSDEDCADLMAETIHRTFEPNRFVSSDEMEAASQSFLQYLNRAAAIARQQLDEAIGRSEGGSK
jgi:AcrR family transcriptional regulator